MPLDVVVVGAGVGGITAAAAIQQAGHAVTVVEKSQLAGDVGAALNLTPNGCRVLRQLGFDLERAGAVSMKQMARIDGETLEAVGPPQPLHGDYYAIHRRDLHAELMRVAKQRVTLRLGVSVTEVDVQTGRVKLADGGELTADLIVGADGVHSAVRGFVLQANAAPATATATGRPAPPQRSGYSAFRFVLPTSVLQGDGDGDGAKHVPPPPPETMHMYVSTPPLHLMWYPCRNGTLQNFVGVHVDPASSATDDKLDPTACKARLLREFAHFHPRLRAVLNMPEEVGLWPLYSLTPLPRWSAGRAILIGDAAHPMLPFSGQGANQAIEDAGALGYLLSGLPDATLLQQRLALFERVRVKRASRVQILSRAVAGWEKDVQSEVAAYGEEGVDIPTNVAERFAHDARFDVYQKCQELLDAEAASA